jgi:quinol-cytochrome oxidoreductase complex cytochrome b subunit
MNWKRFLLASAAVYVVYQVLDFVVSKVFMKGANDSLQGLWRPDLMAKIWVMYAVGVVVAVLFTYIFVKGREGKGISEGVRYGIIMWLFVSVPMGATLWVFLPIDLTIFLQGLIYSLFEMLVIGILVAVIYKPLAPPKAPAQT